MQSPLNNITAEVVDHGGSLGRADMFYPTAPKPWLDLSTGINAVPYPVPPIPAAAFERLPEDCMLAELADVAASCYGAPSGMQVVCAPGTQILLPMVAGLVPPGRARVLSPTYAEHRRAAALCGHSVQDASTLDQLAGADLAIVVNPNNPDGRIQNRDELLDLASRLRVTGGILVVDEAFMDVGPIEAAVDPMVEGCNIVVLRSFGKFFGLAGVRIGFAICDSALAYTLRSRLGPWVISGTALTIGITALGDRAWQDNMRTDLKMRSRRLDNLLEKAGLLIAGRTTLYRYAHHPHAQEVARMLGGLGILVRTFAFDPTKLRFGLPAESHEFFRLRDAFEYLERDLRG